MQGELPDRATIRGEGISFRSRSAKCGVNTTDREPSRRSSRPQHRVGPVEEAVRVLQETTKIDPGRAAHALFGGDLAGAEPGTGSTSTTEGMSPKLTVLHALAPARVGGLESVVAGLTSGLAERGHRVTVASVLEPDVGEHEFIEAVGAEGVTIERVEVPHRAYHVEVRKVRQILERAAPDVVHTHGYRADVVTGTVARWHGLPVVSTVHGFTEGGARNRFYERLQRIALRRFDAVIAVSGPLRRRLIMDDVGEPRVHLVRNAWTRCRTLLDREKARVRLGLSEEGFVVGWVGRLSGEKGPDVFLEAMTRLVRQHDEVVATMIGGGPELSNLRSRVATLGLEDLIHLPGRIAGAAELFRAFDVFVLSSRTEGTPVTLFEAMEAGVPVVATRVGGVPDVVRDQREALLVPSEDPAALACSVRSVYRDPDAARERARRAVRRLRTEFAADPWLDRHEGIYREVLDES